MNTQKGSAHVIIIVVLIFTLIGALGFVFWQNFLNKQAYKPQTKAVPLSEQNLDPCIDSEKVIEGDSVFCSAEVGVKIKIPSFLASRIKKADNYDVYSGDLDLSTRKISGNSIIVYRAEISGNDNFIFSIAKEPIRNGYMDIGDMLQNTYFKRDTGILSHVNYPTLKYDSSTGESTNEGTYQIGSPVKSFTVSGRKVFHGSIGDAGNIQENYFIANTDSVLLIKLANNAYMGPEEKDPSTIDAVAVFNEFQKSIESMEFID